MMKVYIKTLLNVVLKYNKHSFLGYKYYCPICENKLKNFMPLHESFERLANKHGYKYYGQNEHLNVNLYKCPNCKSTDRDRMYAAYFKNMKLSSINNKKSLLHIAPAWKLNNLFLKKHFNVVTTDLMMKDVDYKMNIEDMIEFEDNKFDYFICSHVLEHVDYPDKALQELYRILKPNGVGIIMAPIIPSLEHTLENPEHKSESDRIKHYGQNDHLRLFSKYDFINRIEKANFKVKQLGIDYFGKKTYAKLGLKTSSVLYIGIK